MILTNANMESEKITPCKEHVIFQILHLGGGNSNIIDFHPENWGNDPN